MSDETWIVDDERSSLGALVTVLGEHGLAVRGFSDPQRALEQALRSPPRVVITHYAMADLSGVDLARALREGLAAACPRILLVTATDLRRVELTLFDHVVHKPFLLAELVPKVRSYLGSRSARRPRSHQTLRATAGAGKAAEARAGGQRK